MKAVYLLAPSLLSLLLLACPRAAPEVHMPLDSMPVQEPLGGFGPLQAKMERMEAEADAIIARARDAGGPPEVRYGEAALAIHFAMRPEFGPANAALRRDRKLVDLAQAVGLDPAVLPEPPPLVDEFVQEVRDIAARLRAPGLTVDERPCSSQKLFWSPATWGWQLTVSDPSRTVSEHIAYAGPAEQSPPRQVAPRVTLHFFPLVRLSTSQSLVTRQQPGFIEGAGQAFVELGLQAPQSHDQDPAGELRKAALAVVFPGAAEPQEQPAAAKALGVLQATLHHGVLEVAADGLPPQPLPSLPPTGARVLLWSASSGAGVDFTAIPLP